MLEDTISLDGAQILFYFYEGTTTNKLIRYMYVANVEINL